MKSRRSVNDEEATWPATVCGFLCLVIAATINAFWSGYLLSILFVVVYAPTTWLVAWVVREIGTLFRLSRPVGTGAVWLLVSLWFLWDGYKESRPEEIFRDHLVKEIPATLKVVAANRTIGLEGYVGIYMEGDSNAFSRIVTAKGLTLETSKAHFGETSSKSKNSNEDLLQEEIGYFAKRNRLPVHRIASPILYTSERKAPSRDLWISGDWSRAYFFLK